MSRLFLSGLALVFALALTGCEHPYAQLATLQDPKYPVGMQSKVAFPSPTDLPDLDTRLAGGTLQSYLISSGYQIVPLAEADFLFAYHMTVKEVPQSYVTTVPTISNNFGMVGGYSYSGTSFGESAVSQTRNVRMAQLDVSLETTHEPKLVVWTGVLIAEQRDQLRYPAQYYLAIVNHIGSTFNGKIQLDKEIK